MYRKLGVLALTLIAVMPFLAGCSGLPILNQTPTATPKPLGNGVIGWPFDTKHGQWTIENGYNTPPDHFGSELYSFDFQRSDKPTAGQEVLSPVTGTSVDFGPAYPFNGTTGSCVSIGIGGSANAGYHLLVCHLDLDHPVFGAITRGAHLGFINAVANHLHITLYYLDPGISDTRANDTKRKPIPFSDPWTIGGCNYPANASANQWANGPAPCGPQACLNTASAPTSAIAYAEVARRQEADTACPTPTPAQQMLFLTSSKGMIYGVNGATGQEKWQFDAAGGFAPEVLGQFGTTLVALRVAQGVNNAPFSGTLYGLNVDTGHPQWSVPEVAVYASNANAVVVFGNNGLEAIDPQSGAVNWQVTLPGAPWYGLASGGAVYIISTIDPSQPFAFSAYSLSNGAHLWDVALSSSQSPQADSGYIFTDPANPQTVFATSNDQSGVVYLDAFDASTGNHLWTYSTSTLQPIGVSDNRVVLTSLDVFNPQPTVALDGETGQQVWAFPSNNDASAPLCAFDSFLQVPYAYVPCLDSSGNGALFVLNLSDGSVVWRQKVGIFAGTERGPSGVQAIANGVAYYEACFYDESTPAGAEKCQMAALNANDGSTLWSYNGAYLNVTNSAVIVSQNDGSSMALDLSHGHPVWPTPFAGDGSGIVEATVGN